MAKNMYSQQKFININSTYYININILTNYGSYINLQTSKFQIVHSNILIIVLFIGEENTTYNIYPYKSTVVFK